MKIKEVMQKTTQIRITDCVRGLRYEFTLPILLTEEGMELYNDLLELELDGWGYAVIPANEKELSKLMDDFFYEAKNYDYGNIRYYIKGNFIFVRRVWYEIISFLPYKLPDHLKKHKIYSTNYLGKLIVRDFETKNERIDFVCNDVIYSINFPLELTCGGLNRYKSILELKIDRCEEEVYIVNVDNEEIKKLLNVLYNASLSKATTKGVRYGEVHYTKK